MRRSRERRDLERRNLENVLVSKATGSSFGSAAAMSFLIAIRIGLLDVDVLVGEWSCGACMGKGKYEYA